MHIFTYNYNTPADFVKENGIQNTQNNIYDKVLLFFIIIIIS